MVETVSAEPRPLSVDGYSFRVIGERFVSPYTWLGGTRVGDLSGIDYHADEWYLIADDSSGQPARFYTADLAIDSDSFDSVTFNAVTRLRRPDGSTFPPTRPGELDSADAEAIRVDRADGSLLWASEGARIPPRTLVDPSVRRAAPDGTFVGRHTTAPHLAASVEQTGPRNDRALEGLTLSSGGTLVVSAMEGPLLQDGTAPVRVNFANRTTGSVLTQLVYDLDPLPANGLTEILAVDANHYLVLERAMKPDGKYSVRLYEANTAGARSVIPLPSLAGAQYTPMQKRLLVDFDALGLSRVGNLEGMAWGPTLPSGERTLVFVSDNNCDARTQLVALAVTLT